MEHDAADPADEAERRAGWARPYAVDASCSDEYDDEEEDEDEDEEDDENDDDDTGDSTAVGPASIILCNSCQR